MKLLHYIFELPMLAIAVWAIYSADSAEGLTFSLWPKDSEVNMNAKLVLFLFLLFGYIWGKINSWFGYAPLRRDLRQQKKTNKALNKEQEKLNETVSGLKQNIQGLQEKAKEMAATAPEKAPEENKKTSWFSRVKAKFSPTKGK